MIILYKKIISKESYYVLDKQWMEFKKKPLRINAEEKFTEITDFFFLLN